MSSNTQLEDNNRNTGYDSYRAQQQPEGTTPAQYDLSLVGDGGQQDYPRGSGAGSGTNNQYGRDEGYPLGGNQRDTNLKDRVVGKVERAFGGDTTAGTGYNTTGSGNDNQYGRTDELGGNQRDTNLKDRVVGKVERTFGGDTTTGTGYNTTGLGTGNQYDTSNFPLGAHQRNTNVKDRIVGKVERAFGGNTSGTGADNQYSNGRSGDGYPPGGNQNQGVTGLGTSVDPSVTDKLVGSAKKVAGKVTGNNDLYQEGKARAAGETANYGETGDY